mgnify:FL=1
MVIVVILDDGVDFIIALVSLPEMNEFGVGHEENIIIEKYFLQL